MKPSQGQKTPRRDGWEGRGGGGWQGLCAVACGGKGRIREIHCAGRALPGREGAGKPGESADPEVKVSESHDAQNSSEGKRGECLI